MLSRLEIGRNFLPDENAPLPMRPLLDAYARGLDPFPVIKSIGQSMCRCDNFEYLVFRTPLRARSPTMLFTTLPDAWGQFWDKHGHGAIDPRLATLTCTPRIWTAAGNAGQGAAMDAFLSNAEAHGIGSGVAWEVPMSLQFDGHRSMVAWSTPKPNLTDDEKRGLRTSAMSMIIWAMYFQSNMAEPAVQEELERQRQAAVTLTAKERDALVFSSHGYSVKEAAKAMAAHQRTVEAQLRSAREKLGAKNTTEAVGMALRQKLIE